MEESEKLWHEGFYGGIELEFRQWKDSLSFNQEHELSKEPLVVDLLIIKKTKDVVINHGIGRFFRRWNIVEYKSPEDTLSIDAFYKTLGYASIYKSRGETVDAIPLDELAISIFSYHHPKKLFARLTELGAFIRPGDETGIYYVEGFPGLAVQVIVTRELPIGQYLPFRVIQPGIRVEDAKQMLEAGSRLTEQGDLNNLSALLRVSIAANREVYQMARSILSTVDVDAAVMEVFPEAFERVRAEGQREFITAMLRDHEPVSRIMRYTQAPVEKITEIARSLGIQPVI